MAANSICLIDGCGKESRQRGWCWGHYHRWRRHGDPNGGGTPIGEPLEFYQNIVLNYRGEECLAWPYNRNSAGYGYLTKDGKYGPVSRFVCEDVNGPPPSPDYEAAHSCGNGHQACVSPLHLSWKTCAENKADMIGHGTKSIGESHGQAKLTEKEVIEILSLKGKETQKVIAQRYGIGQTTVSHIFRGDSWAWLT